MFVASSQVTSPVQRRHPAITDSHCFLLYFTLFASANFGPYIMDDRESFKTGAPNFFYFYHGSNKMRTTSTFQEMKYLPSEIYFWLKLSLKALCWHGSGYPSSLLCKCKSNGCMESFENEPLAARRSALHHLEEGYGELRCCHLLQVKVKTRK